jgi:hypothetical protein
VLGKDLEMNNETTVVAMQQISKNTSKTRDLLLQTVFSMWSVQSGYKEENWANQFSSQLS